MTIFRGARAGLIASGVLMLGLSCFPAAVSHAASLNHPVMLVNDKTGKCLTIAGGETTANNVDAVQFNCDSDPSRSWMLREMDGGNDYQIRNVRTGKCLTIAGGTVSDNNVHLLQFDCDNDQSRRWIIRDVTGSGIHQIRNAKTGKCATIAGGTVSDNNVPGVQFDCDEDTSRRWRIRLKL
jgi:cytolethal distending toxin subunit A